MITPTLFDRPLSANKDPISSFEAADKNKRTINEQAFLVYKALTDHDGVCAKELADITGIDHYVCARRLPDLRRLGYAQNCPRPCGKEPCRQGRDNDSCPLAMFKKYKGMKQITWWLRKAE